MALYIHRYTGTWGGRSQQGTQAPELSPGVANMLPAQPAPPARAGQGLTPPFEEGEPGVQAGKTQPPGCNRCSWGAPGPVCEPRSDAEHPHLRPGGGPRPPPGDGRHPAARGSRPPLPGVPHPQVGRGAAGRGRAGGAAPPPPSRQGAAPRRRRDPGPGMGPGMGSGGVGSGA